MGVHKKKIQCKITLNNFHYPLQLLQLTKYIIIIMSLYSIAH
jgi:hypothetical protein